MRIYLIGFMGSGKSHIGLRMAKKIGWNFLDLDQSIETAENTSISKLFSDHGEDHFRYLEKKYLCQSLSHSNTIIATGGGTPCFFDNMDWINKNGLSCYLKCTPELLCKRLVKEREKRPLLQKETKSSLSEFIKTKLKSREDFYQKAHIVYEQEADKSSNLKELLHVFIMLQK